MFAGIATLLLFTPAVARIDKMHECAGDVVEESWNV